jgi:large subunit ribosomal protein L5
MNQMKNIRIEKLTINIGTGKDQKNLERGLKLIKHLTGKEGVKALTNKRIAAWGLRPGLPIGAKITLRGNEAEELAKRFLETKDNVLKESCFDNFGNVSFGIPEYIDIPGIEYNPDIGIMGFQVTITLYRPGYRIARRRLQSRKVPRAHRINKEEAIEFIKKKFNIKVGED